MALPERSPCLLCLPVLCDAGSVAVWVPSRAAFQVMLGADLQTSNCPHSRSPITHIIACPALLTRPVPWEGEHGGAVWSLSWPGEACLWVSYTEVTNKSI